MYPTMLKIGLIIQIMKSIDLYQQEKIKKIIGLMKGELGGKIITEFVTLRPKAYSFLTDDGKENKKAKGTKKCIIKKKIKFNDYKKCLFSDELILKSQQRFISKKHDVYTENVNKIALSNNDDKRIVSSNKISSYPYGYTFKRNRVIIKMNQCKYYIKIINGQ